MKTIKKVDIKPVFVEFIPEIMEANVLYVSDKFGVANHLCLCGCQTQTVTPLGENEWNYTVDKDGKITMSPSILNNQTCDSHYIIRKNVANFV